MRDDQLTALMCNALRDELQGKASNIPEAGRIVWRIFSQLAGQQAWGQYGPVPISWTELDAYCRLNRVPLEPRHIDLIMELDAVRVSEGAKRMTGGATGGTQAVVGDLTAGMFDAHFG